MTSLKKWLPLIIAFVTGVFFALQYYIPHPFTQTMLKETAAWMRIIGGFAMGLGVVSLFYVHINKIKRKAPAWGFSIIVFLGLFATLGIGIYCGGVEIVTETGKMTAYGWIYNKVMLPLQGTMFSILAFFIASAAYRSFRAKTREATFLLIAALIVMFGRVPLGEYLWDKIPTFTVFGVTFPPALGSIVNWIMNVPNMAAQGGIALGICLGVIATSLKIIFGIERAYMGGAKL